MPGGTPRRRLIWEAGKVKPVLGEGQLPRGWPGGVGGVVAEKRAGAEWGGGGGGGGGGGCGASLVGWAEAARRRRARSAGMTRRVGMGGVLGWGHATTGGGFSMGCAREIWSMGRGRREKNPARGAGS